MKLTGLQERAFLCLYRRAVRIAYWRSRLAGHIVRPWDIDQAAGKGAQPEGEPYDLLRWDRMYSLEKKGLVEIAYHHDLWVFLTQAGCREAERMLACKSK